MARFPWISLIVPAYNAEDTIDQSRAALARQTIPRESYEIVVVFEGIPYMKARWASFQEFIDSDRFHYLAILLISINFAVLTVLMFKAYISCNLNGYDVGIYNQIMHNMMSGRLAMVGSIQGARTIHEAVSHFAFHNQAIMYLLLPIYALSPSTFTLGVIQALTLSLAAYALYQLSLLKLKSRVLGLLVLTAFLLYRYSWGPILVTFFHPEAFSLFTFISAMYFLEKGMLNRCFLFTTLAMMCKENMAAIAITLGIYVFLVKKRKVGLVFSLWGLVWFLGSTMLLTPFVREAYGRAKAGYVFYDRYSYLGQNYTEILLSSVKYPGVVVRTLLSRAKLDYLYTLFSPLLFLPLLSPTTLLIALPAFLQNLLSGYSGDFTPTERDVFPIIAFIFISLVYAIGNLKQLLNKWIQVSSARSTLSRLFNLVLNPTSIVAFLLSIVILLNAGKHPLFLGNPEIEYLKEFHGTQVASDLGIACLEEFDASQSCRQVALYLGENAAPSAILSVPTPLLAFSHISGRSNVYVFPRQQDVADYIVIPKSNTSTRPNLGYELVLDTDGFAVMRRIGAEVPSDDDIPPAPPVTASPEEASPIDFFDLKKADIQGALFVTKEAWSIGEDTRDVIFQYPQIYNVARITYKKVAVPDAASLRFGIGIHPEVWDKPGDGVLFEIKIDGEPVFSKYIDPKLNVEDRKWYDFEIDLAEYAGQIVEVSLETIPSTEGNDFTFDWAGWANPRIIVGHDSQRVYDFIDNVGNASSVDANIGTDRYRLARHERRILLQHPVTEGRPARVTYDNVFVPNNAFLRFAIGIQAEVWDKAGDGARFEILIDGKSVYSQYIDPKRNTQDRKWHDYEVSLEEYAGQELQIAFRVAPNANFLWDWAVWADPHIAVRNSSR